MAFSTDGNIGVDLDATVAGTGSSSDEGDQHILGEHHPSQDGGLYMRVHASAAIAINDFVGVDENYEAAPVTKNMADDGWMVGAAQIAVSDNEFFWLCMQGSNVSGNLLATVPIDTALRTSGTAGKLDDKTSNGTAVRGIVNVVSSGTATTAVEVIMTYPRSETF